MPILSREENYRMAKLCYSIKDYAASFRYMEDLVRSVRGELSPSERKLLLSSGDLLIEINMTKINKLSAMLLLEPNDAAVADYHTRLIFEVKMICYMYLDILQCVIIITTDLLSLVMYCWARGDCYRTIVQTMKDDNSRLSEFQNYTRLTIEAYTTAWDEARILVKSNPREIRNLVLIAIMLASFYCDVAEQYMEARKIAQQTLSDVRPTLSDVRPRNIFSLVTKIKFYMECSETDELNFLIDKCNSKLNQNNLA